MNATEIVSEVKARHALIGDENGMSDGEDQPLPTRIRQEVDEHDSDEVNLMTQDWQAPLGCTDFGAKFQLCARIVVWHLANLAIS